MQLCVSQGPSAVPVCSKHMRCEHQTGQAEGSNIMLNSHNRHTSNMHNPHTLQNGRMLCWCLWCAGCSARPCTKPSDRSGAMQPQLYSAEGPSVPDTPRQAVPATAGDAPGALSCMECTLCLHNLALLKASKLKPPKSKPFCDTLPGAVCIADSSV